jgi:hypothetical protein
VCAAGRGDLRWRALEYTPMEEMAKPESGFVFSTLVNHAMLAITHRAGHPNLARLLGTFSAEDG